MVVGANLARAVLAGALTLCTAVPAAAQSTPETPEDLDWYLASYDLDGQTAVVPWSVDATLRLEDGRASGSTGCNAFDTGYVLDGTSLTFDPTVAMMRMACPQEQSTVEDGYLGNLPDVESWSIEEGALVLADADGLPLLHFEGSAVVLTASDVAALAAVLDDHQSELERLDRRVEAINVRTLRERIKTLEGQVDGLEAAVAAERERAASTLTSAEGLLLQGVAPGIRSTCKPLRGSSLPSGTVSAVQCQPKRADVASMAFYLMEYDDAIETLRTVTRARGVPAGYTCVNGKAGRTLGDAPGGGEGCWVEGGKANLRHVVAAAGCHQLNVDGKRLREPAIYVATEGTGPQIKPLHQWQVTYTDAPRLLLNVTRDIPDGGLPLTPGCRQAS